MCSALANNAWSSGRILTSLTGDGTQKVDAGPLCILKQIPVDNIALGS